MAFFVIKIRCVMMLSVQNCHTSKDAVCTIDVSLFQCAFLCKGSVGAAVSGAIDGASKSLKKGKILLNPHCLTCLGASRFIIVQTPNLLRHR